MPSAESTAHAKPLRTILHPALVHLPIALLPLSVLLDVASRFFPQPELFLVRGAFFCILAGIGTGLLAALFGVIDYVGIRNDHPAKKTATLHMVLNVVALGLFAVSAGLRYGVLDASRVPGAALAVSLVALGVLGYSGYLGGRLVYDDGIAVGKHRRRTRTPEETREARTPQGSVAVADADALREGETLRADVNGTIVAIAKIDGACHAFQEFCTHRHGPLSEGALIGCEVMCPWHRSRFDVRTGKVTAGPAKLDLRTFRTEVRDGKIWVEVPEKKT